jgi:hypothetical protein
MMPSLSKKAINNFLTLDFCEWEKAPEDKFKFGAPKMGKNAPSQILVRGPNDGQKPRNKIWFWAQEHQKAIVGTQKWAKAPGVKFEFGSLPKMTNAPRVKFYFGPLNPKRPQWVPKVGKTPQSNIWVWETPQKDKFPQSKIWGWANKDCGCWVWWASKIGKSPRVKFEFGDHQQCVVKDRYHFKGQCS